MLPRFDCDEPIVQFLEDGRNVRLLSEMRFFDTTGYLWEAHKGKETDGASIPELFWPLIGGPYEGDHRDAAILHDEAYGNAPATEGTFCKSDLSAARARADQMIYEATLLRVSKRKSAWLRHRGRVKAWLIYHALRMGGWLAWYQHAKENAAKVA